MTLARCKASLLGLIADPQNKVIALSGKWGTGKTHMWRKVCEETDDEQAKSSISVSLFGVNSINDLKLKVAQAILPTLKSNSAVTAAVGNLIAGTKKILRSVHSGFSALDELGLLAAPLLLKGRFIVIDDIERKHEKLSIDEILGFIDECVQVHGCRILLVLNSDKLSDKLVWEQFREKVIDQELRLDTTPSEAFDIGLLHTPTAWADQVKPAIELCSITNIRIIRKIIGVANRLLGGGTNASLDVLKRVIPSTVLLSAIHYKALETGPDFDFVLGYNSATTLTRLFIKQQTNQEVTAEEKTHESWSLFLRKLGIEETDEYEVLVVDFLTSGLLDSSAVEQIIHRYISEGEILAVRERTLQFYSHCDWYPDLSDADLIGELEALLPAVTMMDMYAVSALAKRAEQLTGNTDLARFLIHDWLEGFRARIKEGLRTPSMFGTDSPIHPDIAAELKAVQQADTSSITLLEVYEALVNNQGWGARELEFLRATTKQTYDQAIRTAQGPSLQLIMYKGTDILKHRHSYGADFCGAAAHFLAACRSIVHDEPGSRRAEMIIRVFEGAGMAADLLEVETAGDAETEG